MSAKDPTQGMSKDLSKQNINSGFGAKGALLCLSFHVLASDQIKCYMYLNGQVSRFMADDIIQVLPRYFVENDENKKWIKSTQARDLVNRVKKRLVDKKFDAFLNEYSMKRKI